jgi:hypothetical protein
VFSILPKYSHIIKKTEIVIYEFEEDQVRIKIELELTDASRLIIKDYKFSNNTRKYSYHWMSSDGKLKTRWDNAPHWESVSTFPHHRHFGSTENILFSTETDVESILEYIEKVLKKSQHRGSKKGR